MAMNFWEAQKKARARTTYYVFVFFILTFAIALLIEYAVRLLAAEGYTQPMPFLGLIFLGITFAVAGFYYLSYKSGGGRFVAETLGGRAVSTASQDLREQQLLNVVAEMAVASRLPIPEVFILDAKEINAFAAGTRPDNAVIAVTRGALQKLNRDELQGVIAHEFSHIYNADMLLNMRLAAMVMGFVFMLYIGIRLLEGSFLFGRKREEGNSPIAIAALIFLVAGAITWFAGALLRSMVSRQREYLADASAVQYTRNPLGIANALRKIEADRAVQDMPRRGMAYSHLYFNNQSFWSRLFSTHPPVEKRIAAILGKDART